MLEAQEVGGTVVSLGPCATGQAAKCLFQIRGPACAVDTVISFNEKF